jgi:hypothetical protein
VARVRPRRRAAPHAPDVLSKTMDERGRTIELPPELFAQLERIARDEGRSPEAQALHLLWRCVGQYSLDAVLPPDLDTTTDAASAPAADR